MTDEELILICAVRYTLGRMTYMVRVVCTYVASQRNTLSKHCINIIIKDIEEALDMCHRMGWTLGMDFDEREWVRLLEVLKSCTTLT